MDYFLNFAKGDYVQGKRPDGCILCKLVQKNADITDLMVFSSPNFGITVNLYPFNPGHLLIFSLRHIEDLRKFTQEEQSELWMLRNYLLNMLDSVYHPHAYNVGVNMGLAAGASILHLHEHIIPRYPNEIGIPELMGGKRVLVEDPRKTCSRLKKYYAHRPFSMRST
jgi:ATP adenylyltransferase